MVTPVNLEEYDQGQQELERQFARDALRIVVARAEGTEFSAIPAGSFTEKAVAWDRAGTPCLLVAVDIERVVVLQTGGTATSFDVELRTKAGGANLDRTWYKNGNVTLLDERFSPGLLFLSEQTGADRTKIHVAIQPTGGPGTYLVRIYARPRR